jgi:hypothetical protein
MVRVFKQKPEDKYYWDTLRITVSEFIENKTSLNLDAIIYCVPRTALQCL